MTKGLKQKTVTSKAMYTKQDLKLDGKDEHIYDKYIRHTFKPFVKNQLEAMWTLDQFERIQHVLSADNYYRQPESTLINGPKSAQKMLKLLTQNINKPRPLKTAHKNVPPTTPLVSNTPKPVTDASNPPIRGREISSPLISGREIMAQVSGLVQDLPIHWKFKHEIGRRFCKFLLRRNMLRPAHAKDDGKDSQLHFEDHLYYTWNIASTTASANMPSSSTNKVTVVNLEAIVMSQMNDMLKSQRELIAHLQREINRNDSSSDSEQERFKPATKSIRNIIAEKSFHSVKLPNQNFRSTKMTKQISYGIQPSGSIGRTKLAEKSFRKIQLSESKTHAIKKANNNLSGYSTKFQMTPSMINLNSLNIPSDPEIYYDANQSTTGKIKRPKDKSTPKVNKSSQRCHRKDMLRPTTAPRTINEHKINLSLEIQKTADCNDTGILSHIKRNLTFGHQSLVSTAMGLKSYLFKGASTSGGTQESNVTSTSAEESTPGENCRRRRVRPKRDRPLGALTSSGILDSNFTINSSEEEATPEENYRRARRVRAKRSRPIVAPTSSVTQDNNVSIAYTKEDTTVEEVRLVTSEETLFQKEDREPSGTNAIFEPPLSNVETPKSNIESVANEELDSGLKRIKSSSGMTEITATNAKDSKDEKVEEPEIVENHTDGTTVQGELNAQNVTHSEAHQYVTKALFTDDNPVKPENDTTNSQDQRQFDTSANELTENEHFESCSKGTGSE